MSEIFEQQKTRYCGRCGTPLCEEVCPLCGAVAPDPKQRRKRTWETIVVFLAAIALIMATAIYISANTGARLIVNKISAARNMFDIYDFYYPDYAPYITQGNLVLGHEFKENRTEVQSYTVKDYSFIYSGGEKTRPVKRWGGYYYAYPAVGGNEVSYSINFVQLEGDIPNLDAINEALRWEAFLPADIQLVQVDEASNKALATEFLPEPVDVSAESYITYMSERYINVAFHVRHYIGSNPTMDFVTSLIYDLKTGKQIYADDLIDKTDELALSFREALIKEGIGAELFEVVGDDFTRSFKIYNGYEGAQVIVFPDQLVIGYNCQREFEGGRWYSGYVYWYYDADEFEKAAFIYEDGV